MNDSSPISFSVKCLKSFSKISMPAVHDPFSSCQTSPILQFFSWWMPCFTVKYVRLWEKSGFESHFLLTFIQVYETANQITLLNFNAVVFFSMLYVFNEEKINFFHFLFTDYPTIMFWLELNIANNQSIWGGPLNDFF